MDQGGISTTRAVYQQHSKLKRMSFWSTWPCRPGRCINHNQKSETISGAAVYHERGVLYINSKKKIKIGEAKESLDDTAVSTRAVYRWRELYYQQHSKLKRKHFWSTRPCRPARCINHNQKSEIVSGAALYHKRGKSVIQQP